MPDFRRKAKLHLNFNSKGSQLEDPPPAPGCNPLSLNLEGFLPEGHQRVIVRLAFAPPFKRGNSWLTRTGDSAPCILANLLFITTIPICNQRPAMKGFHFAAPNWDSLTSTGPCGLVDEIVWQTPHMLGEPSASMWGNPATKNHPPTGTPPSQSPRGCLMLGSTSQTENPPMMPPMGKES